MGRTNVRWKPVGPDVVAHTTASVSRRLRGKQSGPWKDTHTGDVCEVVTAAGANPSATCTVTSWADIQRWPTHNLNCVISDRGQDAASTFCDNFAMTSTTSSAFSGICADIIADNVMCSQLSSKMTGRTLSPSVCVATCDFSTECQLEHVVLPGGPECIFTDILEFASPALTDRLTGEVAPYDFGHILSMCLEPGAVRTCAPCARGTAMSMANRDSVFTSARTATELAVRAQTLHLGAVDANSRDPRSFHLRFGSRCESF